MSDSTMVGAIGPGAIGCSPETRGTQFPYVKIGVLADGKSMELKLRGSSAIRLGRALTVAGETVENKERALAVEAPPQHPLSPDYEPGDELGVPFDAGEEDE